MIRVQASLNNFPQFRYLVSGKSFILLAEHNRISHFYQKHSSNFTCAFTTEIALLLIYICIRYIRYLKKNNAHR